MYNFTQLWSKANGRASDRYGLRVWQERGALLPERRNVGREIEWVPPHVSYCSRCMQELQGTMFGRGGREWEMGFIGLYIDAVGAHSICARKRQKFMCVLAFCNYGRIWNPPLHCFVLPDKLQFTIYFSKEI